MKKLSKALIMILAMICLFCLPVFAAEAEGGVDAAIVIDVSGSMKQTDPERVSIDAAKLFIDMMETSGSRAGLVPFSDELGEVLEITEIESASDKEAVKAHIDELAYTNGDTDIGMAVKEGFRLLSESSNNGNQKALLFFTDGNIDLGTKRIRTDEDSLQDVRDAVAAAKEENMPIYTIGLNANGNVDKQLLADMATQTGGRSYIVDSADDLPTIFNEIFADFINSNIVQLGEYETDGVNFTEIPLNIPNGSVMEANIIMLTTKNLTAIEMVDPDGQTLTVDGQKLILSQSNHYNMVKMVMPKAGDWTLKIKSSEACKVHVNLIFNYKVSLKGEASFVSLADGTNGITAKGIFEKEGQVLSEEALYEQFTGTAIVTAPDGTEQTYPMTQNGCSFEAEIPAEATGTYKVVLRVDSDTMYRESDVIELSMDNHAPTVGNVPPSIELSGFASILVKEEMDLSDWFADADGDVLTYEAESKQGYFNQDLNDDGVLTLKPAKNGDDVLTVRATDPSGMSVTAEVPVVVSCTIMGILPFLLIPIIIILIIIVLLNVKKKNAEKNAQWYGKIRWMVVKGNGFGGGSKEQVYDMGYERGSIPLSKIVMDPNVSSLDLGKVTLTMNGKTNSSMFIQNRSKKCKMASGFGGSETSSAELNSGDFVMLQGTTEMGEISVKVTYSLNMY